MRLIYLLCFYFLVHDGSKRKRPKDDKNPGGKKIFASFFGLNASNNRNTSNDNEIVEDDDFMEILNSNKNENVTSEIDLRDHVNGLYTEMNNDTNAHEHLQVGGWHWRKQQELIEIANNVIAKPKKKKEIVDCLQNAASEAWILFRRMIPFHTIRWMGRKNSVAKIIEALKELLTYIRRH